MSQRMIVTAEEYRAAAARSVKSADPLVATADALNASPDRLIVRAAYTAELPAKAAGDPERSVPVVISTETTDRERDQITVAGWRLEEYRRNPVVLAFHDYRSLPIGRGVNVRAEDARLKARIDFTPAGMNPMADTILDMMSAGFLSGVSVGFQPMKMAYNEERRGVDFLEQSLLEFSVVPIPANAECLVEARSAGVDIGPLREWAAKVLDRLGAPERTVRLGIGEVILPEVRVEGTAEAVRKLWAGWAPLSTGTSFSSPGQTISFSPPFDVDDIKAAMTKRGRVLSGVNERRLREAADAAQAADAKIREVVAQVEAAPEATGETGAMDECPMGADCPKGDASECPKGADCPMSDGGKGAEDIAKPFPNEHSCRLHSPDGYDRFRRGTREHEGKTYSIIFGHPKSGGAWEEQAYRYPKDDWTAAAARSHCGSHDGSFEAASGGDAVDAALASLSVAKAISANDGAIDLDGFDAEVEFDLAAIPYHDPDDALSGLTAADIRGVMTEIATGLRGQVLAGLTRELALARGRVD
jgi:HK97 family phage prohead protease